MTQHRPINAIAADIFDDIATQYEGKAKPAWLAYARPYLQPMLSLYNINQNYGYDSAESIVLYALSNLQQYRGEKARAYKAELKALLPRH